MDARNVSVAAERSDLQQQAALYALSHWTVEARAHGVHEDDVRDAFEKALDWARGEYGD